MPEMIHFCRDGSGLENGAVCNPRINWHTRGAGWLQVVENMRKSNKVVPAVVTINNYDWIICAACRATQQPAKTAENMGIPEPIDVDKLYNVSTALKQIEEAFAYVKKTTQIDIKQFMFMQERIKLLEQEIKVKDEEIQKLTLSRNAYKVELGVLEEELRPYRALKAIKDDDALDTWEKRVKLMEVG